MSTKNRIYKDGDWEKVDDPIEPFVPQAPEGDFPGEGVFVTQEDGDRINGCGGVSFLNEYEGVAWVKVSRACNPISAARTIVEMFDVIRSKIGDLIIYAYVLDGFDKGLKLATLIGMSDTKEVVEHDGKRYRKMVI